MTRNMTGNTWAIRKMIAGISCPGLRMKNQLAGDRWSPAKILRFAQDDTGNSFREYKGTVPLCTWKQRTRPRTSLHYLRVYLVFGFVVAVQAIFGRSFEHIALIVESGTMAGTIP